MAGRILTDDGGRAFDSNGNPISGAKLIAYRAGTSTAVTLYTTKALAVAHASPVVANSAGQFAQMWADESVLLDVKLYAAADVTYITPLRTFLNVTPQGAGGGFEVTLGDYTGTDLSDTNANDTPLSAALTAAYANRNKPINLRTGTYKLAGETTVTQGVAIIGEGSQGSTETYGTVLKHYSNGNLLTINGNGADSAGTGGGFRNLLLAKANTYAGGVAMNFVATNDAHRPGEMIISNVLILGIGTATWTRGIVIDGSLCDTLGARGVRSTYLFKTRVADVTTAGESYLFKQVAHLFGFGVQADTGTGAASGIRFSAKNQNVHLYGVNLDGKILIDAGDGTTPTVNALNLHGQIGSTFINNDTASHGNVTLALPLTGDFILTNKSPRLSMRTTLNPRFQISLTTATANDKTGDGTAYTVSFDTEQYDWGNNWLLPDGIYIAKCAGPHRFHALIKLANIGAGHTTATITIARTGSATTNIEKSYLLALIAGTQTLEITGDLVLAFDDQVVIKVAVSGSTKTVGVDGSATLKTLFEGQYVG